MTNNIRKAQDRLKNKKWGIFNHYLWNPRSQKDDPEYSDWTRTVDSFDTEKLAKTLHELGAGYYFITIVHGTQYLTVPSERYEKLCGVEPFTLCPRRDIVLDLYESLSKYDIDLYLYFNAYTPIFTYIPDSISLGFMPDMQDQCHRDPEKDTMPYTPTLEFSENWASVLEELSVRYGNKVKGWWLDSCYDFVGYTFETLKPYYDAIKKGNPDALCAFNNGVKDKIEKWYPDEDMTAGEFNEFICVPDGQFTDGAQNQVLIPLGHTANGGPAGWFTKTVKISADELSEYKRRLEEVGCALTVEIYVYADGSFEEGQVEVLRRMAGKT